MEFSNNGIKREKKKTFSWDKYVKKICSLPPFFHCYCLLLLLCKIPFNFPLPLCCFKSWPFQTLTLIIKTNTSTGILYNEFIFIVYILFEDFNNYYCIITIIWWKWLHHPSNYRLFYQSNNPLNSGRGYSIDSKL